MKTIYSILGLLMLGLLTQAMQCEEEFPENTFIMSDDEVPQEPYLTTISSDFFRQNIVGQGWKWKESWRINSEGVASYYDLTTETDFIPYDLYFGVDSMTVFLYKPNINERRSEDYIYDATNNRVLSKAIVYMQIIYADPAFLTLIDRIGDYYYRSHYERMLPFELNARWNGSKPVEP